MASPIKIKGRKVIHTSSTDIGRRVLIIATCNDGTMWQMNIDPSHKLATWEQVPDVPL